jgi:uncharacterized protein YhbP (UPF0306 family)
MSQLLSVSELNAAHTFIASQSTLALATVNAQGLPQVAPLFYVSDDDLNLYWLSSETSHHSINLKVQPQVAATIYPSVWDWQEIHGLQIEGLAMVVDDAQKRESILTLYRAKFALPPEFDAQIKASTPYILQPTWVRWLDNRVNFGYKSEITL